MNCRDIDRNDLPTTDLHEMACRLAEVKDGLEEVNDDYTRQEVYDRMGMSTIVINDVIEGLTAVERVMRAVVDG